MKDKDKIIAKQAGTTAILAAATAVDSTQFAGYPLLNTAVSLFLSLYGAAAELRSNRAIEFIQFIQENPGAFVADFVKTSEFQDSFVYTLEKYIRERNNKKRDTIKKIFLGYADSNDKESFELERMINTLSLMSFDGIRLLITLKPLLEKANKNQSLSEYLLEYLVQDSNNHPDKYKLPANTNIREIWADAETDLISIGLLRTYNIPRYDGSRYHDYDVTRFGEEFMKYIAN